MAGLLCTVVTPKVPLVANTPTTVVQLAAPANQRGKLIAVTLSFDGTNAVAAGVLVQLVRQSSAGTGTAVTPKLVREGLPETPQFTAHHTFTAEPSYGDVLMSRVMAPYFGAYDGRNDYEREDEIAGGSRIGIVCTNPTGAATVNVVATLKYDE